MIAHDFNAGRIGLAGVAWLTATLLLMGCVSDSLSVMDGSAQSGESMWPAVRSPLMGPSAQTTFVTPNQFIKSTSAAALFA